MVECVKCGRHYSQGDLSCSACTWPFAIQAWSSTKFHVSRVTLDTNCINEKLHDSDLNKLESWAEEGLLRLQRSDEMLRELSGVARTAKAKAMQLHPSLFRFGAFAPGVDALVLHAVASSRHSSGKSGGGPVRNPAVRRVHLASVASHTIDDRRAEQSM